jgi:hypothetical protein
MLLTRNCALAAGCVQRRLTIRSNPPARWSMSTTIRSAHAGVHRLVYYGNRKVRLVKSGYETRL